MSLWKTDLLSLQLSATYPTHSMSPAVNPYPAVPTVPQKWPFLYIGSPPHGHTLVSLLKSFSAKRVNLLDTPFSICLICAVRPIKSSFWKKSKTYIYGISRLWLNGLQAVAFSFTTRHKRSSKTGIFDSKMVCTIYDCKSLNVEPKSN